MYCLLMFAIIPSDREIVICMAKTKISQGGNIVKGMGGSKKVDLYFLIEQTLSQNTRQR